MNKAIKAHKAIIKMKEDEIDVFISDNLEVFRRYSVLMKELQELQRNKHKSVMNTVDNLLIKA